MKKKARYIKWVLALALVFSNFAIPNSTANAFSQVIPTLQPEILLELIDKEILQGNEEGDYVLDRSITRAEWLTLLKRVVDDRGYRFLMPSKAIQHFDELEHHWAKDTIIYWLALGMLQGDANGQLHLDRPITFAEVLVLLDRIVQPESNDLNDADMLPSYVEHWSYPALNRLYQQGLLQLEQHLLNGELDIDRYAMRGEGLVLLMPYYQKEIAATKHRGIIDYDEIIDQKIDVDRDGLIDFSFRLPSAEFTLTSKSVTEEVYTYFVQKDWLYEVQENKEVVGDLQIRLSQIQDQDLFYFIRYTPFNKSKGNFTLELISYGEDNLYGRIPISEIGEDKLPQSWQYVNTIDSFATLPHASMYLSGENWDIRIAAVDTYQDHEYSVRHYPLEKQTDSTVEKTEYGHRFTYAFTNEPGYYSETWGVLAPKGLFAWEQSYFSNFMLRDDMSINRKLSLDGLYYRTPHNYVPRTTYSYYLNPANIMGVRAVGLLQEDKTQGRFIDDFVILLGRMAANNLNDRGYWPTLPKSEWLEEAYGIGYEYYDNRRNADNATFLLLLNRHYPDEYITKTLQGHVHYLFKVIDNYSIQTSEYGVLFTDYIGIEQRVLSHVALNHHVAVINFLLDYYNSIGDELAKSYALRMVMGIEDTVKFWIKDNHDLYYALFENLSPHPYPDYIDLTKNDLLYTQGLLLQLLGTPNESIQQLIDSKSIWIDSIKGR